MKLFDGAKGGVGRKSRRLHDKKFEVENSHHPRSEAEGTMKSEGDLNELC